MGRAAMLCQAGPSIFGVKLGRPVCATCSPCPVPFCQAPARVELWQPCLFLPFLPDLRHGIQVAVRARGDITSNGPKCGNSVNKVYFTFNFGI